MSDVTKLLALTGIFMVQCLLIGIVSAFFLAYSGNIVSAWITGILGGIAYSYVTKRYWQECDKIKQSL